MSLIGTRVHVEYLYAVSCAICKEGAIDGEYYIHKLDAMDARDAHIREHRESQDAKGE